MEVWTKKEGYPCVFITKQGNSFRLEQQRFGKDSEEIWTIPIKYITNEGIEGLIQFNRKEMK